MSRLLKLCGGIFLLLAVSACEFGSATTKIEFLSISVTQSDSEANLLITPDYKKMELLVQYNEITAANEFVADGEFGAKSTSEGLIGEEFFDDFEEIVRIVQQNYDSREDNVDGQNSDITPETLDIRWEDVDGQEYALSSYFGDESVEEGEKIEAFYLALVEILLADVKI